MNIEKIDSEIIGKTCCNDAKNSRFLENWKRNTAETCVIDFLFPLYYTTSIVLRGLLGLLLPVIR